MASSVTPAPSPSSTRSMAPPASAAPVAGAAAFGAAATTPRRTNAALIIDSTLRRRRLGRALVAGSGGLREPLAELARERLHVDVDDRRPVERQELRENQPADDGEAERASCLR